VSVESEINRRGDVPDLLGVAEAAALLRVGLTFAYASTARFIATGSEKEIPAIKVGRLTRVPRVAFERFLGAPITWPIPEVERPCSAGLLSVGAGPPPVRLQPPRFARRQSPLRPRGSSRSEAVVSCRRVARRSRRRSGFRHLHQGDRAQVVSC